MSFLKIDDNVPHHPKHLKAGAAASWLWLCGVAYCQRHLTDGYIPAVAMPTLGVSEWRRLLPVLLEVKLFEQDGNDYRVHDFLGHNDSAESRRRKSDERNARVTRHRERKRNALQSSDGNLAPTPTPTPITTTSLASSSALPPSTSGPRRYDRQHAGHVFGFCDFKCLSEQKIQQFAKDLPRGLKDPENFNRVLKWAEDVRDRWGDRPIHEPEWWLFWQARWSERASGSRSETVSDNPLIAETEARMRSLKGSS